MGDNQQGAVAMLLEGFDALGNNLHCVHIKAAIGFVQNSQLRIEHQKLQDFGLLLFATAKAGVQIALSVFIIHL